MDYKITFIIHRIGAEMCRITANCILTGICELSDGGCIMDMDCLMDEMQRITKELREKFDAQAVFEIVG